MTRFSLTMGCTSRSWIAGLALLPFCIAGCESSFCGEKTDVTITVVSGQVFYKNNKAHIGFKVITDVDLAEGSESFPSYWYGESLALRISKALTIQDNHIASFSIGSILDPEVSFSVELENIISSEDDFVVELDPTVPLGGFQASSQGGGEEYCADASYHFKQGHPRQVKVTGAELLTSEVLIPYGYVERRRPGDRFSADSVTFVLEDGNWPEDASHTQITIENTSLSFYSNSSGKVRFDLEVQLDEPLTYAQIETDAIIWNDLQNQNYGSIEYDAKFILFSPAQKSTVPIFDTAKITSPFYEQYGLSGEASLRVYYPVNYETAFNFTTISSSGTFEVPFEAVDDLYNPRIDVYIVYQNADETESFYFDKQGEKVSEENRYFSLEPGETIILPEWMLDVL